MRMSFHVANSLPDNWVGRCDLTHFHYVMEPKFVSWLNKVVERPFYSVDGYQLTGGEEYAIYN
jgi:hypothetical protein